MLNEHLEAGTFQKNLRYFITAKARESNSSGRKIIEAAAENIGNYFESNNLKYIANIYCAAILLGSTTLKRYIGRFKYFPPSKIKKTREQISKVLQKHCNLNEIFADWVSKNLSRIKDNTLPFISEISNKNEGEVRFSIVVSFESEKTAQF